MVHILVTLPLLIYFTSRTFCLSTYLRFVFEYGKVVLHVCHPLMFSFYLSVDIRFNLLDRAQCSFRIPSTTDKFPDVV